VIYHGTTSAGTRRDAAPGFTLYEILGQKADFCYDEVVMSWSSNRQLKYISIIVGFFAIIAIVLLYPVLTKAPTCTDRKQNGNEQGVDCGGSCSIVCSAQASVPVILWNRAFPVTGSVYNLLSMVENPNKGAAIARVSYEFRVFDTNNKLIGRRTGETYLPANQKFAVFEPRFDAGEKTIRSVSFEFTSPLVWIKRAPTIQTLPIRVTNVSYSALSTPTLSATVSNESIYNLPEFDVIAILYDKSKNAINVSKTHKESLKSNTESPLLFTWPSDIAEPVTQDLLLQINPFTTPF
jgi:hypothetical protein